MATGFRNNSLDNLCVLKKYILAANIAGKWFKGSATNLSGTPIARKIVEGLTPTISRGAFRGIENVRRDTVFTVTKTSCTSDWPVYSGTSNFSEQMAAYLPEYEQRSLKMRDIYSAEKFGLEYQTKKDLCAQHNFTGLIISKASEESTIGDVIKSTIEYLEGLDDNVGYVCTIHDPTIDSELVIDSFGDPEFDCGRMDNLFGKGPVTVTQTTSKRKKDESGYSKICNMG